MSTQERLEMIRLIQLQLACLYVQRRQDEGDYLLEFEEAELKAQLQTHERILRSGFVLLANQG